MGKLICFFLFIYIFTSSKNKHVLLFKWEKNITKTNKKASLKLLNSKNRTKKRFCLRKLRDVFRSSTLSWLRPTCSLCKWQQWDLERVVMFLSNVQGHAADLESKLKFLLSRPLQCELLSSRGRGYKRNGVKFWRPTGDLVQRFL